jgi:hypothetical protein
VPSPCGKRGEWHVWKTDEHWAGKCGTFTLKLDDESVHTAGFQFKK